MLQDKKQQEKLSTFTVKFNREKTTTSTTTPSQPVELHQPSKPGNSFRFQSPRKDTIFSKADIINKRISALFSKEHTAELSIGGAGRSFGGVEGEGAQERGHENRGSSNTDMGGKERVPKPSHTSSASFSNMSAVGATLGSPTTLAAGRDGPLNSNSTGVNNIRSASSNNKPCCFCWCCCCSCSW